MATNCDVTYTAGDDIFDDDADELSLAQTEFSRLEGSMYNGGYREGLAKSEDVHLQSGFNDGFKRAAHISFKLAKLRGILSALVGVNLARDTAEETSEAPLASFSPEVGDEMCDALQDLIERVATLEENHKKPVKFHSSDPQMDDGQQSSAKASVDKDENIALDASKSCIEETDNSSPSDNSDCTGHSEEKANVGNKDTKQSATRSQTNDQVKPVGSVEGQNIEEEMDKVLKEAKDLLVLHGLDWLQL